MFNKKDKIITEYEYIKKRFKIEIIITIIEEINYCSIEDLCEFISFITGKEVNESNYLQELKIAKSYLIIQYPNLHKILPFTNDNIIEEEKNELFSFYKRHYGDNLLIKSYKPIEIKKLVKRI